MITRTNYYRPTFRLGYWFQWVERWRAGSRLPSRENNRITQADAMRWFDDNGYEPHPIESGRLSLMHRQWYPDGKRI